MLFENSPTPLNRVVLAVVRRIVEQLDWLADEVTKLHHAFEKLGANSTTFRSIIHFQLQEFSLPLLLESQFIPPILERIHNEITGLVRTTKVDVELSTVFIHDATRNILLLASQIMVTCLVIASGLSSSAILTNIDRSFTIQAQSFNISIVMVVVFGNDIVKIASVSGSFCGLALTTGRKR